MSYDHASERFYSAVDRLASGTEEIQDRLDAALEHVVRLRPAEIPDEVLADFQSLVKQISERGPIGSLKLDNEEASEIASRIVSMFVKVEKAFHLHRE